MTPDKIIAILISSDVVCPLAGRKKRLADVTAKLIIYRALIEGEWEAPGHLARVVNEQYFNPRFEEFQPRTMWSLSNAFTSAFQALDATPQFKAAAKLGPFLEKMNGGSPASDDPTGC